MKSAQSVLRKDLGLLYIHLPILNKGLNKRIVGFLLSPLSHIYSTGCFSKLWMELFVEISKDGYQEKPYRTIMLMLAKLSALFLFNGIPDVL